MYNFSRDPSTSSFSTEGRADSTWLLVTLVRMVLEWGESSAGSRRYAPG